MKETFVTWNLDAAAQGNMWGHHRPLSQLKNGFYQTESHGCEDRPCSIAFNGLRTWYPFVGWTPSLLGSYTAQPRTGPMIQLSLATDGAESKISPWTDCLGLSSDFLLWFPLPLLWADSNTHGLEKHVSNTFFPLPGTYNSCELYFMFIFTFSRVFSFLGEAI